MNLDSIIKKVLKEADASRYAGSYNGPLTMGEVDWADTSLGPFKHKVSKYYNADLEYDSYDGTMDSHKKNSKKLEAKSIKISKYNKTHKQLSDEEGGPINPTPGKGKKIVPIVGEWVELDKIPLNEDLAVWFGTKKKPKGSKQPKGPWVNICRKVDGKHPPCGRSNTDKGGYPKCRAAGVAGKMSDSEKKSACQQKRSAEKKDTQSGKGQKPVMTSYKPKNKKTNENMKKNSIVLSERELISVIKKLINENVEPSKTDRLNLFCQNDIVNRTFTERNLTFRSETDYSGGIKRISLNYAPDPTKQSYERGESTFTLDFTPENALPEEFKNKTNLDELGLPNTEGKVFLIGKKQNQRYFCSIDSGTDSAWGTYFDSL
jgi:hypothetical protein